MAKAARKKPLRQRPAFKKLRDLLKETGQHDLLWYHKAGAYVEQLFPMEGGRQWGEGKMETIAEALRKTKKFAVDLWKYRSFFLGYKRDAVAQL